MKSNMQYIHLQMERGERLSIGYDHFCLKDLYEAPDLNKLDTLNVLEIRYAVSCCSYKDRFERKKAHRVIAQKMNEGNFLIAHQRRVGGVWERSYDTIIRAFNNDGHQLLPESWKRKYPGLKLEIARKILIDTKPVLIYTTGNAVKVPPKPLTESETAALVSRYKATFGV